MIPLHLAMSHRAAQLNLAFGTVNHLPVAISEAGFNGVFCPVGAGKSIALSRQRPPPQLQGVINRDARALGQLNAADAALGDDGIDPLKEAGITVCRHGTLSVER